MKIIVFIMRDLLRKIKQGRIDMEKFNESYPSIIDHLTKTKFRRILTKLQIPKERPSRK